MLYHATGIIVANTVLSLTNSIGSAYPSFAREGQPSSHEEGSCLLIRIGLNPGAKRVCVCVCACVYHCIDW